jgi:hypothetical protein
MTRLLKCQFAQFTNLTRFDRLIVFGDSIITSNSCPDLMDTWDRLKRWNNQNAFFAGFRVSDNRLRKSLSGLRL